MSELAFFMLVGVLVLSLIVWIWTVRTLVNAWSATMLEAHWGLELFRELVTGEVTGAEREELQRKWDELGTVGKDDEVFRSGPGLSEALSQIADAIAGLGGPKATGQ